MKRFYSAANGGFYDENLHGAMLIPAPQTKREKASGKRPEMIVNPACRIPDDAVEISETQYQTLLAAQGAGQKIVARGSQPVAVDRAATPEELEASRRLERDRRLSSCDWTQLADTLSHDPELKGDWATYREALRDLDMADGGWPSPPLDRR